MATAPPSYDDATKGKFGNPNPNYLPDYQSQQPYPVNTNQDQYGSGYPPTSNDQSSYQAAGDNFGSDNFTSFTDKSIRRAFIRKVYLILTAQLLCTSIVIAIFQFVLPIRHWVQRNSWFYYLSYGVFLVTYITLVCCASVRRKYPGNFIALSIFTLAFTYMTATIATFYDTPGVLAAAGITTVLCVSITIFAVQTKIDFTLCSGMILVLSIVLLLTGLTCGILYAIYPSQGKVLHGLYAGLAILVFGMYLIYDTQMIMGGRNNEMSPEDYIEGALQLYLDIVNLFLIILSLFGHKN